jgi:hypothetical protein
VERDRLTGEKGEFLRWACPHLGPKVEEIVGAVVAGLEEVPPAPTHGDLKPENILFDGNCFALLDLDRFAEADPVLDVANILTYLAIMPLRFSFPHDHVRRVARAFAEEYFAYVPEVWLVRLPLHYAGAVLRVAAHTFRRQKPGWPDKIEALVEEAENSLAGRVW